MIGDNKNKGFTLVEMLVAMTVFVLVAGAALSMLFVSLRANRTVVAEKKLSESVNFAVEFMSRQMRVAREDTDDNCPAGGASDRFGVDDETLTSVSFLNSANECVRFFLEAGSIKFEKGGSTTLLTNAQAANIRDLRFLVRDSSTEQPRITIVIDAAGVIEGSEFEGAQLNIQTTVTARELDLN